MSEYLDSQRRNQNSFFVDGGTLPPETPSYVTRPADHDLLQRVKKGEFCYVLTARQMGKSSLTVRTARSLQENGVKTAIVDLTIIGTPTIEQWYLGLLRRISSALTLGANVSRWWREHKDLGPQQRFFEFLHDVVLDELPGSVAIFIDEIDTTLNLGFRDDFFAGIRAVYNARASDSSFKRLTFVMIGVATPTDLIKDQKRTPFNIGSRIELRGFRYEDATPLLRGLEAIYPGQSDRILRRIFHWTNGHPYLTQKLCLLAAKTLIPNWDDANVDRLVQANFLDEDARSDSNLTFVQDRIQSTPPLERRPILELYSAVHSDTPILNDDRSAVQNYLELLGLVRVEMNRLHVSNEIYRYVFSASWANMSIGENTLAEGQVGANMIVPTEESTSAEKSISADGVSSTDECPFPDPLEADNKPDAGADECPFLDPLEADNKPDAGAESISPEEALEDKEQTPLLKPAQRKWMLPGLVRWVLIVFLVTVIIIVLLTVLQR